MARFVISANGSIEKSRLFMSRAVPVAALLACMVGANGTRAAESPEKSKDSFLTEQSAMAEQGNFWAKYALFSAYRNGTHGVEADLPQADRWLQEIVVGLHLVTFAPGNGFHPRTPQQLLAKFHEYSSLKSGGVRLGGTGFFRTRVQEGTLVGSFLTENPEKMAADIKRNPSLRLLSTAKVTPGIFVMHESSSQESLPQSDKDDLAEQLREAKSGNYWAKYRLWAAYRNGTDGVQKDPEEARKWLAELVKGTYLATFRPVKGFSPKTPGEFLADFSAHSTLRSEPTSLGGASLFRTKVKDGALIGSFLTEYPEKMRQAIAANPSLELVSIEEVTPETFIRHDASPQESLK